MGKYRKKHEWAQVFKEQQQSGLSIIEFCKQHAISTTNFYKVRANMIRKAPCNTAFIKATLPQSDDEHSASLASIQTIKLTTKHVELSLPSHCSSEFIVNILKGLNP